eukprot:248864-Amorphochlora_amoeboformis.AAC.1
MHQEDTTPESPHATQSPIPCARAKKEAETCPSAKNKPNTDTKLRARAGSEEGAAGSHGERGNFSSPRSRLQARIRRAEMVVYSCRRGKRKRDFLR